MRKEKEDEKGEETIEVAEENDLVIVTNNCECSRER
jgi:hypothetical protein